MKDNCASFHGEGGVVELCVLWAMCWCPLEAPVIIKEMHKMGTIKHFIMEGGEKGPRRPCLSLRIYAYLIVSKNGEREEGRYWKSGGKGFSSLVYPMFL